MADEFVEYDAKNVCIRKFIDILGYLPVYYQRKEFEKQVWVNPNLPKVIELKRQQLMMVLATSVQTSPRGLAEPGSVSPPLPSSQPPLTYLESLLLWLLYFAIFLLSLALLFVSYRTRALHSKRQPPQPSKQ